MKNKIEPYQIRFNTNSDNDTNRWRLICDDEEKLVSKIYIDSETFTTKDYIDGVGEKWHITTNGILEIKNDEAFIKTKRPDNSILRHIVKTISWRIIGTIDTMVIGWVVSGNLKIGLTIGGIEVITKMILYFLHERFWFKIKFIKN